ncbi:hypothetical protein HA402_015550 [Bradysia odoriphaga]|nr:hypothetical protein HA402_015550 [Bradysia odoriphaga]
MTVSLNTNRHTWTRPRPIFPKDHFKSNEFIGEKPFIPSFNNRNTIPDTWMLLRWDYYRIYAKEHQAYIDERLAREAKMKAKAVIKDITGLNKKRVTVDAEPKEMFKMARFKNIPAKVSHRRCIACAHKRNSE